jgi:hypothetical protein
MEKNETIGRVLFSEVFQNLKTTCALIVMEPLKNVSMHGQVLPEVSSIVQVILRGEKGYIGYASHDEREYVLAFMADPVAGEDGNSFLFTPEMVIIFDSRIKQKVSVIRDEKPIFASRYDFNVIAADVERVIIGTLFLEALFLLREKNYTVGPSIFFSKPEDIVELIAALPLKIFRKLKRIIAPSIW